MGSQSSSFLRFINDGFSPAQDIEAVLGKQKGFEAERYDQVSYILYTYLGYI